MQIVAQHLANLAKQSNQHSDLFARSAFNRYYYACYLLIRDMCGQIPPFSKGVAHKNIPDHLRNVIAKEFRKKLKRMKSSRSSVVSKPTQQYRSIVLTSLGDLAAIIELAYKVRIVADYEPEVLVLAKQGGAFELAGRTLSEAEMWENRVVFHIGRILNVWQQIQH